MLATIIIPVKDDPRILVCVESVLNQTISRTNYEIIVVDNDSVEFNLQELLVDFPVQIYSEKRPGIAAAVNCGLLHAKGEFLVRIDADCIATNSWLEEILLPFENRNIAAVGGIILKAKAENLIESASRELVIGNQADPQYLPMYTAPYIVTANAAYRMNIINQIGGFDEQFKSGSDVDISWQIQNLGYLICTIKKAVVYHSSRNSIKKYFIQFYLYGIGHALLFKKYRKLTGQLFLVNVYPFLGILRVCFIDFPKTILMCFTGKPEIKITLLRNYLDLIEYVALICGDVIGAIRYKVLYL